MPEGLVVATTSLRDWAMPWAAIPPIHSSDAARARGTNGFSMRVPRMGNANSLLRAIARTGQCFGHPRAKPELRCSWPQTSTFHWRASTPRLWVWSASTNVDVHAQRRDSVAKPEEGAPLRTRITLNRRFSKVAIVCQDSEEANLCRCWNV